MKKIALFTLAYFVISMAWAYPWHVIWFHQEYQSWGAITRDPPIIGLGMLAIVIQGLVIAYLYRAHAWAGNPILAGIKFTLVIGLMVYTVMGFATAAKFKIEPVGTFLAYHTAFQVVQFVLTGAVLGWIFRPSR